MIPPMSQIMIRAFDNENRPIFAGNQPVDRVYFNLVKLAAAEIHQYRLPQFETVVVPMAGTCDVTVDGGAFSNLGGRADIWDGKADSVYAGPNSDVVIVARSDCEIAIAGGLWDRPMARARFRHCQSACGSWCWCDPSGTQLGQAIARQ